MERAYIGRYRVLGTIGQGGMGTIVRALDEVRGREVAIKLPNDLDQQTLSRLQQECNVLAQLEHQHIVQVYGSGSDADPTLPFYMIMEFVDGVSVDHLLRQQAGRLEPRQALRIALGVAEALAYAHRPPLRIIHRDIKPSNILIRKSDGAVKVTDFGIAAVLSQRAGRTAVGTLAYMAPEQGMGQGVDERADLYSLGATLYEMLTGQRPPQLAASTPTPPSILLGTGALPPEALVRVDQLMRGLLERDPARRLPQQALEVAEELRSLLEGRSSRVFSGPPGGARPSAGISVPPAGETWRASGPQQPAKSGGFGSGPRSGSISGSAPYQTQLEVSTPPPPPPPPPVQGAPLVYYVTSVTPPAPSKPTNTKAIIALVLGIASYVLGGILTAIPAVILGHLAKREIRRSEGMLEGDGLATVALALGYGMIGLSALVIVVVLLIIASTAH